MSIEDEDITVKLEALKTRLEDVADFIKNKLDEVTDLLQRLKNHAPPTTHSTLTITNQPIISKATTASPGVQDTDFAAETANLTKQQTLQQASTAILAQANQLPSAVLKLLV